MTSDNDQDGVVGAPLAEPIVVKLINDRGKPVSNYLIAFEAISGGGRVTSDSVATDSLGTAESRWILDSRAAHPVDPIRRNSLIGVTSEEPAPSSPAG